MRNFTELSEKELLALAISSEEEDGRIFADFAEGLRDNYPASAKVFDDMAAEENEHRRQLIDLFVAKFGDHIPLVRRQDVRGWVAAPAAFGRSAPLGVDVVRRAGAPDGAGRRPFLPAGGEPDHRMRRSASSWATSPTPRPSTRAPRREIEADRLPGRRSGRRGRGRPAPLRAADHPARPCRADGRLGVHPRAGLRCRLRHA